MLSILKRKWCGLVQIQGLGEEIAYLCKDVIVGKLRVRPLTKADRSL